MKENQCPKVPKIEYRGTIDGTVPYLVNVDKEGAKKLLQLAGVDEKHIDEVWIIIDQEKRVKQNTTGYCYEYDSKDVSAKIVLYTDYLWERQRKVIKRAKNILSKQNKPRINPNENQFPELRSGKRLSSYLRAAPNNRALATVDRLIIINAQKEIAATLAHESKHAADSINEKRTFSFLLTDLTNLITDAMGNKFIVLGKLFDYLDPKERRARKFEQKSQQDSIKPLILLTPNG